MNEQIPSSIRDRSPVARAFRWLFVKRGRRLIIVLAWVATVLALLYAAQNWSGRRAWDKYRKELEARGEQLDLAALIPKPVPDEQNFAATPFVQSWFVKRTNTDADQRWDDNYSRVAGKVSSSKPSEEMKQKGLRHLTDLTLWARAFEVIRTSDTNALESSSTHLDATARGRAAPAVLAGLKPAEGHLTELREASRRRYSRYPVVYTLRDPWAILLPHLANVKAACQRLQLRACAELATGRSDDALEDVKLMVYLGDSIREEPFLISFLVRLACIQIAIQPVWEGLIEHRWSDTQLQQLQTLFQKYDFLADLKRPLASEHAAGILTADLIRERGVGYLFALGSDTTPLTPNSPTATALGWLIPRGWYEREKLNYSQLFHVQQNEIMQQRGRDKVRILPSQVKAGVAEMERALTAGDGKGRVAAIFRHQVLARLLLPALGRVSLKAANAQVAAEQAAIGCALERYRLAKGEFPQKLESLAPEFIAALPRDPITSEPYRYHTNAERFTLYSVGWNGRDDGGTPGNVLFDEKEGDWLWR